MVSFVSCNSMCLIHTARPTFSEAGPTAVKNAYHPNFNSEGGRMGWDELYFNDIVMNETSVQHIITRMNQSEKSAYVRSVVFLAI
jgi:DNA mismatch repair ATPase MutS